MAGALKAHPMYKSYHDIRRTKDRLATYRANFVEAGTGLDRQVAQVIIRLEECMELIRHDYDVD